MPRPRRCRRVCSEPDYIQFFPGGIPCDEMVILTVDEYEVIRLIDLEKLTHEQCAQRIDISRTTVTEICESAREKIADSIVNGKELMIKGGNYRLCKGNASDLCGEKCRVASAAESKRDITETKGEHVMRIAVTYENGNVYQHFGHTEQFKIYDTEEDRIVQEVTADTNGSGHSALAGFLKALNVDTLICGGIGAGAQNALADAGIRLYGGVSGNAEEAVKALLAGNLVFDPDIRCSHHGEGGHGGGNGHRCGGHGKGHRHGGHGEC